jgi:hypothetical protein
MNRRLADALYMFARHPIITSAKPANANVLLRRETTSLFVFMLVLYIDIVRLSIAADQHTLVMMVNY